MRIRSFLLTTLLGLLLLSGAVLVALVLHQRRQAALTETRQATGDIITIALHGTFLIMEAEVSPKRVMLQWNRLQDRMAEAAADLRTVGEVELADAAESGFLAANKLMIQMGEQIAQGNSPYDERLRRLTLLIRSRLAIIAASAEAALVAARERSRDAEVATSNLVIALAGLLPLIQLGLLALTHRHLFPQVKALIEAATRMRSGQLEAPVPVSGRGEIGQLGATLETMRASLLANRDALEQRNSQLKAKSEEVEAFVYAVSHDLRGPLVNLVGFTGEVGLSLDQLESGRGDGKQLADMRQSVDFISTNARRLESLIDALLRLSRSGRQDLEPEATAPGPIVGDILANLTKRNPELEISYRVDEDLPPVWIDPSAAERIFSNLLENAVKYRDPERALQLHIRGSIEDERVLLEIADNGLGFPESARSKLFRAFQRYHPDRASGEGMGLAIVYRLAERSGGSIAIADNPGGGTVFSLILPAAPHAAPVPIGSDIT